MMVTGYVVFSDSRKGYELLPLDPLIDESVKEMPIIYLASVENGKIIRTKLEHISSTYRADVLEDIKAFLATAVAAEDAANTTTE